eukprot:1338876-Prymnesium_polylepis.1
MVNEEISSLTPSSAGSSPVISARAAELASRHRPMHACTCSSAVGRLSGSSKPIAGSSQSRSRAADSPICFVHSWVSEFVSAGRFAARGSSGGTRGCAVAGRP